MRTSVPKATLHETLGIAMDVVIPTVAKGVIIRRPKVVGLAERPDLDRRAVRRMQRLRDTHGTGPLLLPVPFRRYAVILDPEHVHRVLEHSPEPFATASSLIAELRSDANWAFLRPKRTGLRRRFFARLNQQLARAEPGSLAAVIAETHVTDTTAPSHQVPQWLFAFDPARMTTFRALALLAFHPEQAERAREEIRSHQGPARLDMPYLRACVLESLRLWPTTPMVLRESTKRVRWETGVMPAKTGMLIFAPFFHRDGERLPYADRFNAWREMED
jgi:hypothetical protein